MRANRDDDLEIAAGMECVLKWRAVVALTPEERALAMAAAPSVDGANPAEAIEDFVRRNSTLDFDDIRAMPRPLRRHLLDSRVKELATYADEDKIAETDLKNGGRGGVRGGKMPETNEGPGVLHLSR